MVLYDLFAEKVRNAPPLTEITPPVQSITLPGNTTLHVSLRRKDRMPDRENERPARTKAAIHFFTKIVERLQVSTKKTKYFIG